MGYEFFKKHDLLFIDDNFFRKIFKSWNYTRKHHNRYGLSS